MSLKAAIYDPYLDTLGGGERYCLSVAEILVKHDYEVDIFWSGQQDILEKAKNRFALDLSKINLVPDIFGLSNSKIEFVEVKSLGNEVLGQAKNGNIYISERTFHMGTKMLAGTLFEEFLHLEHHLYDESREMQNYLIDVIMSLGEIANGDIL